MRAIPRDVARWLDNTHGLIVPEEGRALAALAAKVPANRAIVEIGSHTGLSTCWMAAGSKYGNGAHIVAIDPYPEPRPGSRDDPWELGPEGVLARFYSNVAGTTQEVRNEDYGAYITLIRATSLEMAPLWTKPIGLLFIDAIHTYDAVAADYWAWGHRVAPGGWLALNDYFDDPDRTREADTARVVRDVIEPSGEWGDTHVVWNTWIGRRR